MAKYLNGPRRRRIEALTTLIDAAVWEGLSTEPEFEGDDIGRVAREVTAAFERACTEVLATEPPEPTDGDGRGAR